MRFAIDVILRMVGLSARHVFEVVNLVKDGPPMVALNIGRCVPLEMDVTKVSLRRCVLFADDAGL